MGASLQAGGSEGRRRRRASGRPMSEINVTPFVDVMLVLLIIFMVAAPLLTVGVPLELPKTQAQQLSAENQDVLTISIDQDGKIFLQETEIPLDEIVPKLTAISKAGYDEPIFVRGDWRTNYGTFMQVMGTVSGAGFKRLTLVSNSEDGPET
jgi:biopolymer transport protein TolR